MYMLVNDGMLVYVHVNTFRYQYGIVGVRKEIAFREEYTIHHTTYKYIVLYIVYHTITIPVISA